MQVYAEIFHVESEMQTKALASKFGMLLKKGDIILLEGDIGAGKSIFARALIQSLQYKSEEVPSPTFTLIQSYDTHLGVVWHADLYRLNSADELEELGFSHIFDNAILLVEWPDILIPSLSDKYLKIEFETTEDPDERIITFCSKDPKWLERLGKLNEQKI